MNRPPGRLIAPPCLPVAVMMLYLVQHGQDKTEDEDPQRPVTDRGADDVTRVARLAVGRLGCRPGRVVHSGKTRARQTAEIWGRLLDIDTEEGDGLAPNDDATTWVERLAAETADLMLVGHLPHLGRLATALVTGESGRQLIGFQQGGLVALERVDAGWMVALALPPSAATPISALPPRGDWPGVPNAAPERHRTGRRSPSRTACSSPWRGSPFVRSRCLCCRHRDCRSPASGGTLIVPTTSGGRRVCRWLFQLRVMGTRLAAALVWSSGNRTSSTPSL
jgi:phosphohistidine phosphatase